MNDYRKISIVNELNEETNEWEIKSVVIFRNGSAPVIEDFNEAEHLGAIAQFIGANGFDVLNNGLANAAEAGLISVVRREDRKEMAVLNSEILQEQIKYSNTQTEEVTQTIEEEQEPAIEEEQEIEKTTERRLQLSREDRQLADYFRYRTDIDRKNRLNSNGQLPPIGIRTIAEEQAEIERLANENERVAALEEARKRLSEGRLSQDEYDRIYNTYRAQLAEAIKNVEIELVETNDNELGMGTETTEPEEKDVSETESFNDEDQRTFDAMMDVIDMCRECRVDDEKFEVIINRGLEDNSTREVRITLVGGIARDSFEFSFANGELFDKRLNEIIANVSVNDEIVSREETPTELSERISSSITVLTTEEGNQILIRYSAPAKDVELESEIMDSNPIEPGPRPEEPEIVVEPEQAREATNQPRYMLNLANEDRELANYFRLAMLRDYNQLSAEQLQEMNRLAETNERVAALEEARRRLSEGRLSQEEYNRIHDTYRAQLAEAIKNADRVEIKEEGPTLQRRINLPAEDRQLADYFRRRVDLDRKTRLNNNGQLSPVGIAAMEENQREINRLASENERVAGLEEARRRINEGRLSQSDYDRIYSTYRAQLADSIKEVATQSQENDNTLDLVTTNTPVEDEEEKDRLRRRVLEILRERRDALQQQENATRAVSPTPAVVEPVVSPVKPETTEPVAPVVPPVKPGTAEPVAPVVPPVKPETTEPVEPVVPPVKPGTTEPVEPVVPPVKPETTEPVAPVVPPVKPEGTPAKTTNPKPTGAVLKTEGINDGKPVQTAGDIPTEGEQKNIPGVPGKVKVTSKGKKFLQWIARGAAFVIGVLGLHGVANWLENRFVPKTENTQNVQEGPTTNVTNTRINSYFDKMNVPAATRAFISQDSVMAFLGEFQNEDQFNEVLSALCYGYEANILTTKDGNFRLDADGNNYLRSFTSDFLCAKVVVNNYTPEQMRAVFGDSNITYEQIMDGFRSYCTTVAVYGTTATENLPFKYLTNGDINATEALENLSTRLSIVNLNRENGTLTSRHTDAFISAVHKMFVQNDQSLGLTEGTKTVATALVDAYMYSQAQVSNGEALYLHADDGYAKAGINLREIDGRISIVSGDSTAYQFSNLYDVINYGYGDLEAADSRCVTAQQVLLENLSEMRELSTATTEQTALEFANLLYQNGMKEYGDEISKGNYTPELLARIEAANPVLSDEVDQFEQAMRATNTEYVPFERVTTGVDSLLGITQTRNNVSDLINVRRSMLYMYNDYEVTSGKRYVSSNQSQQYRPTNNTYVPDETITNGIATGITTNQEQVDYEDLTPEEQEEAASIIEQLQQAQQAEQTQDYQEGIDEMREAVAAGATEEEVAQIGADHGIVVDENYYETMTDVLNQQAQGEELAAQTDEEYERRNEQARKEAEERARREAEEEERRRAEQQALIEQSQGLEAGTTYDPQTDPDRVDHEAGEQPYVPTSSATKEGLIAARDLLTAHMDIDSLGLEAENDLGNTRTM